MKVKAWFGENDVALIRGAADSLDSTPLTPSHCGTCKCPRPEPTFHFFDDEREKLHDLARRMVGFVEQVRGLEAAMPGAARLSGDATPQEASHENGR